MFNKLIAMVMLFTFSFCNSMEIERKDSIHPALKIVYWSDYACPYCYIGEKRLESALDELGVKEHVEIEMKAFELDPSTGREVQSRTDERFAKKYGLTLEGARAQIEQISKNSELTFCILQNFLAQETVLASPQMNTHCQLKILRPSQNSFPEFLEYHTEALENLTLALQ